MQIELQIILSQFDERIGPFTFMIYPKDIPKYTQTTVSSVTIDFFNYTKKIPNELAIMSFPQVKAKGLVKFLEWKDLTRRGGKKETTLSILFNEKDDSILYKYKDDIEEEVNEFLKELIPLIQKNENKDDIQKELKKFNKKIQDLLLKLDEQEKQVSGNSKAFPETQEKTEKADFAFKTIIIGDPGVGKTSMILQFTDRAFRRSYIPTIGANITEKTIYFKEASFQMVIWDLAGQSKFQKIRSLYYNGAQFIILVFDLTDRDSFNDIKSWYADVKSNFSNIDDIEVVLCGNKCDLEEEIKISKDEALNLANELNLGYLETSARVGKNIDKVFVDLVDNLISKGKIEL
ncbi:MAG: Rab family GTPase [Promethearchaeota archaeon]